MTVEATRRGIHRRTHGQRIVEAISQIPHHCLFQLGRNLESGRRLQTQHGIPPPSNVVLEPRTPACRPEIRLDIDSPQGAKLIIRPEAVKQVPAGQLHRLFDG